MKHLHLAECHSTQSYLIDNRSNFVEKDILVSTDLQTAGFGRRESEWLSNDTSLAMSFTLSPNAELTLTTIELGLIYKDYFNDHHQKLIDLKWPNDLFFQGKKCGGIIMKNVEGELICGVGINLNSVSSEYGFLFDNKKNVQELTQDIYSYILKNRIDSKKVIRRFNDECFHVGTTVKIVDGEKSVEGIFLGINNFGAATVEINGSEEAIYAGSLFIIQ